MNRRGDFQFNLQALQKDEFGNWLSFGYPIWGGWLPFVGFRMYQDLDKTVDNFEIYYKTFTAEWLLYSFSHIYRILLYKKIKEIE